MAKIVNFSISGQEEKQFTGWTQAVPDEMPPGVPEDFVGTPSTINIAYSDYKALVELPAEKAQDATSQLLNRTLAFAVCVTHEFAHALQIARGHWSGCPEKALGDGNLTEAGYDLESFIFGGMVEAAPRGNVAETPLVLADWLCAELQADYLHRGGLIFPHGDLPLPYTAGRWTVSDRSAAKLFQKAF
jgi:hypothetical protein